MAWSFGHWLILIVAVLAGLAAGWVLRGRRDATAGGLGSPMVEGDPVAGTAAVVSGPAAATTDEVHPEATVDPAPTAVADHPAPGEATSGAGAGLAGAAVATDTDRADDVDPADMVLTGDPVPAPDAEQTVTTAASPLDTTAGDDRTDGDVVLPVSAELTGPTDGGPTADPAADADRTGDAPVEAAPVVAQRPAPADEQVTPADDHTTDTGTEAAPVTAVAAPVEPETTPAAPAEPAPPAAEPVTEPAQPEAEAEVEPEAQPVTEEPVAVPATRPAVATPPVRPTGGAGSADDFRRIQGVGPKIAAALQAAGIRTYRQLAELDEAALRETIRGAGLRAAPGLTTWPQQAKLLAGAPEEAAAALPTPVGGIEA